MQTSPSSSNKPWYLWPLNMPFSVQNILPSHLPSPIFTWPAASLSRSLLRCHCLWEAFPDLSNVANRPWAPPCCLILAPVTLSYDYLPNKTVNTHGDQNSTSFTSRFSINFCWCITYTRGKKQSFYVKGQMVSIFSSLSPIPPLQLSRSVVKVRTQPQITHKQMSAAVFPQNSIYGHWIWILYTFHVSWNIIL